ncbi:phospholipase D/nuclease [Westerdykella ornata]|uniref:Phospholipase D/nuclease n=1 Tax=Westerdykella ornata TaxID=318751 RepID=A0A6A6JI56_WESOR|nr:phospholipase D/nuclease [Westerdykella ornata]KAF2275638.1 phospholipase D/nuclease [Westerdykella ornata]
MEENPSKRRRLDAGTGAVVASGTRTTTSTPVSVSTSLSRPISPPPSRRARSETVGIPPSSKRKQTYQDVAATEQRPAADGHHRFLPSPIRLTKIRDLSPQQNVDAIGLEDVLGDPLIKECWNFNYLFNVDWVMQHFDPDVRSLVKVKIVHGFWQNDNERRHALVEAAERYPNVGLITAYMPDRFGTHHSKMLILIRHDDQAQIIIHTANMINRDWANMTQAAWLSPLLPLETNSGDSEEISHPIGTGERFKTDLLRYLSAYGNRLRDLTTQLRRYDFSSVRAAFIGSTPSRQDPERATPATQTSWGWLGLREILSTIPVKSNPPGPKGGSSEAERKTATPNIVVQISSIATLGANPTWLTNFKSVLATHKAPKAAASRPSFFAPTSASSSSRTSAKLNPTLSVIFPTAQEIRLSLDGYASGDSIHMRIQSTAQQGQLEYLHPLLCHWNPSACGITDREKRGGKGKAPEQETKKEAHRNQAAPHIKTYIRFQDNVTQHLPIASSSSSDVLRTPFSPPKIDWALVTSANLSKQAWGDVQSATNGKVWIQSWECGVVVWPDLFADDGGSAGGRGDEVGDVEMVPVFGKDVPDDSDLAGCEGRYDGTDDEEGEGDEKGKGTQHKRKKPKTFVGFRMPYDLPLERYREDEVPWCATMAYEEPDWMGRTWSGY